MLCQKLKSGVSFSHLRPMLDVFLIEFSLSSCPQHSLKFLRPPNAMYSTVKRIFHFSYFDPD
jgi:hypothetical protein